MNLYFAPMEGITGAIYRKVHHKHFAGIDKYYAPFVQPNPKRVFVPKEERDILPENNIGVPLVPQVLTCVADGFIRAIRALEDYGYEEVNLNLGCPSGTVVSKGKGAGMLADAEKLDAFFEEVFAQDFHAKISVKTRIGLNEESDFDELLDVFQKYPICELMIHPRYRTDFYKGEPRMEIFEHSLALSGQMKLCFNGNVFSVNDYQELIKRYGEALNSEMLNAEISNAEISNAEIPNSEMLNPEKLNSEIHSVMIGRGLLANPALAREIRGGTPLSKEEWLSFHDDLFEVYSGLNFGEKNTLFKMKELWNYWGSVFEDADRELKRVRKADKYSDYVPAVKELYRNCEFTERRSFLPGQ